VKVREILDSKPQNLEWFKGFDSNTN
jgi:hypothetical protein